VNPAQVAEQFLDPFWRLNNLYAIVDKQGNKVRFRENTVQERISSNRARRQMILKARQFGVSTYWLLRRFDKTIWTKNTTTCILAHEQDAIKKLFRIVRRAYDFMDPRLKPRIDRGGGSKYELYFPDINSRIYCDLESRGDTIQQLHVSEAAFIKDPDRLRATLQAVPVDGEVSIETTPFGMGNHFYDMWTDEDQSYARLFFPWYIFEEYRIPTEKLELTEDERALAKKALTYGVKITHPQIAFRRLKQAELKHLFIQEYPEDDSSCFLASGAAAMDLMKVKPLFDACPQPVRTSEDGTLRVFKEYDKTRRYVCGCDTSEGVGRDLSVAQVFDARSREQVAVLAGRWKPQQFAEMTDELCREYTTGGRPHPLLAVERNNHGHAVILELEAHLNYPNLYVHKDERIGWVTDKVTRPLMIDTFIDGVENKNCILNDRATLGECLTLVDDDGKIEAAPGKTDDRVIAGSIALQMCIESGGLDLYDNIGSRIRV
jgi:hypothetical protein